MNKRRWTRITLGLLATYLVVSGLVGIFLAEGALHPPRRRASGDDWKRAQQIAEQAGGYVMDVRTAAPSDQANLGAWQFMPHASKLNGDGVLILHGVSDSRVGVMGLADFLMREGYMVLVPDSRAHGDSDGNVASYGHAEAEDVYNWAWQLKTHLNTSGPWHQGPDGLVIKERVKYARDLPGNHSHVFVIGGSMGGAIALQALRDDGVISAIVAEAPFSDFREIAYDRAGSFFGAGDWLGRTVFRTAIEAGILYARLMYGVDLGEASPVRSVKNTSIPILLIHGENDRNNPIRHSRMLQAANPNIELWAVPGLGHTSASGVDGPQFQRRVLELFARGRNQQRDVTGSPVR